MVFRKKIPARAKKNFRKVARKMVTKTKPKINKLNRLQGDQRDFIKITMSRQLFKRDFT